MFMKRLFHRSDLLSNFILFTLRLIKSLGGLLFFKKANETDELGEFECLSISLDTGFIWHPNFTLIE